MGYDGYKTFNIGSQKFVVDLINTCKRNIHYEQGMSAAGCHHNAPLVT